jgi:hypothetical protein
MPTKSPLPSGGQTVAVYLTKEQVGYLRRAARAEETTVSEIVRRCVRRYFFLPESLRDSHQIREAS